MPKLLQPREGQSLANMKVDGRIFTIVSENQNITNTTSNNIQYDSSLLILMVVLTNIDRSLIC